MELLVFHMHIFLAEEMRIDKFLNIVNLTKRRSIAQDMCLNQVVFINGNAAKPSKEIKVGDIIDLVFFDRQKKLKVLDIPKHKTIPKQDTLKYIEEII